MARPGRRSFYLAEIAVVLAVVGLLSTVLVYSTIQQINRGRAKAVTADLENLARASLRYYLNTSTCPAVSDLKAAGFIPAGFSLNNCFGQPYWINCTGFYALAGTNVIAGSVTADMAKNLNISAGIGPNGTDQVEVFESQNLGAAASAAWNKNNIY